MGKWLCQRCGNCCRWPGLVRVNEREIVAIASFVGVEEQAFIDKFTEITPDRRGLTLISKEDGSCFFLDGHNTCRINAVKPLQCSGFPNSWTVPNQAEVCEAIWDEK